MAVGRPKIERAGDRHEPAAHNSSVCTILAEHPAGRLRSTTQMSEMHPEHEPDPTRHEPIRMLPDGAASALDLYIRARSGDPSGSGVSEAEESAPKPAAVISGLFDLLELSSEEAAEIASGRASRIFRTARTLEERFEIQGDDEFVFDQGTVLSGAAARVVDGFADGRNSLEALRVLELLEEPESAVDSQTERQARIDRVMAAISKQSSASSDRFRLAPPSREEIRHRRRIQFSDFVALAAVLLVGTAVLFPSLFSANSMALETQCAFNMQQAGIGFELFGKDHDGRLPAVESGDDSPRTATIQWWKVGDPSSSHSANLFVLIREDYVPMEALACPGNDRAVVEHDQDHAQDWARPEQVSYSYQLFNGRAPRYSDPGVKLLLTDRSPVITPAMRGEVVDATQNSQNHRRRGQNLLLPDLSVFFVNSPVMADGDNMWLPRTHESSPRRVKLSGSERPLAGDAFVGP